MESPGIFTLNIIFTLDALQNIELSIVSLG